MKRLNLRNIASPLGTRSSAPDEPASVPVSRFYFSNAQAADISPAFGAWAKTSGALRRKLLTAKEAGESLTSTVFNSTGSTVLNIQLVSAPLVAQTITGAVKCYSRAQDLDDGGAATSRLLIKIVSGDGATLRGTLLALGSYGPGTLWSAFQNRIFADDDALTEVIAQSGDRLVVEIGADDANGNDLRILRGAPDGTADLPENETEEGALVPWIEFSNAILMQA